MLFVLAQAYVFQCLYLPLIQTKEGLVLVAPELELCALDEASVYTSSSVVCLCGDPRDR